MFFKLNARWDEKGMNRKGCAAIPQAHSAWSKRPAIYLKTFTLFQVLFMDCPVWIFVISLETEIVQLAESCTWQYFVEKWIFEFLLASPWVLFVCWTTQFPRGIFQPVDLSEVAGQCNAEPGRRRDVSLHVAHEPLLLAGTAGMHLQRRAVEMTAWEASLRGKLKTSCLCLCLPAPTHTGEGDILRGEPKHLKSLLLASSCLNSC